jgi:SAM-dependent methyltransferase
VGHVSHPAGEAAGRRSPSGRDEYPREVRHLRWLHGRVLDTAHAPTGLDIDPLLRCPDTGQRLRWHGRAELVSDDGASRYPVVNGVPILLAPGRGLFRTEDYLAEARVPWQPGLRSRAEGVARRIVHAPPSITRNVGSDENYAELARLLHQRAGRGGSARVLVVGGATEGTGIRALLDAPWVEATETDVVIGARTQVVCDGHDLPFADGTFDATVCQGMLQLATDPARVVGELHRVLAPGGYLYSETPFLQPVHGGSCDFTRWTHVGHLRLLRGFDPVRSGAHNGPGMALAWALSGFATALAGRSRLAHALARRLASLAAFWLTWFDRRLTRSPGGIDAAAGTYVLGRRREVPRTDREIVASYRGAVVPPHRLIVT